MAKPKAQRISNHDIQKALEELRALSVHEYAAGIFTALPKFNARELKGALSPISEAALKATVFLESGGKFDVRPPITEFSESKVPKTKDGKREPEYVVVRTVKKTEIVKGKKVETEHHTYHKKVTRTDRNTDQPINDFDRSSSAYGSYQFVDDTYIATRAMLKTNGHFIESRVFEHPETQARFGATLALSDTRVINRSLTRSFGQPINAEALIGSSFQYIRHLAGAPDATKIIAAYIRDPHKKLSEVWGGAAIDANQLKSNKIPGKVTEWKVKDLIEYIHLKYDSHLDNIATAQAISRGHAPDSKGFADAKKAALAELTPLLSKRPDEDALAEIRAKLPAPTPPHQPAPQPVPTVDEAPAPAPVATPPAIIASSNLVEDYNKRVEAIKAAMLEAQQHFSLNPTEQERIAQNNLAIRTIQDHLKNSGILLRPDGEAESIATLARLEFAKQHNEGAFKGIIVKPNTPSSDHIYLNALNNLDLKEIMECLKKREGVQVSGRQDIPTITIHSDDYDKGVCDIKTPPAARALQKGILTSR